jgi:WD40 repeat protein
MVSAFDDNTVKIWDVQTGKELLTLNGHSDEVNSANFSPDGTRVVSASNDKTVKIWDAQTGKELLTFDGHSSGVIISGNFSPDGTRVVSASSHNIIFDPSDSNTIKVWDAQTGEELQTLKSPSDSFKSVNFSPDGTRVVSASDNNTVKIWDAQTGEELKTLNGHSSSVYSANFSPDGQTIVSASRDKTVKLWKIESFEELLTRACQTLTPWLQNPNSEATDADRALCDLPPREATIEP